MRMTRSEIMKSLTRFSTILATFAASLAFVLATNVNAVAGDKKVEIERPAGSDSSIVFLNRNPFVNRNLFFNRFAFNPFFSPFAFDEDLFFADRDEEVFFVDRDERVFFDRFDRDRDD